MKILVKRGPLLKALSHAHSVVERRTTVPILSHLLLEAKDGTLKMTSTDLELSVIETVAAAVEAPGRVTVPAHLLYDIVRKFKDDSDIELFLDTSNAEDSTSQAIPLIVKSKRSKFKLPWLAPEDFPVINISNLPHSFEIPAQDLKSLIDRTKFAMCNEETRYYLNGIYFHAKEEDELRAVATDGHRLARASYPLPQGAAGMPGIIVSRKTIQELLKLLDSSAGTVKVSLSEIQVSFELEGAFLTSRLIDGTFPDYERVVPQGNDKKMMIQVKPFSEAVDRVSTISMDRTPEVNVQIEAGKLTLTATNTDSGAAREEVEVEYEDENLQMGFNSRYLLDISHQIGCEEACFLMQDSNSPVIVNDDSGETLYVVMPLRG